MAVTNAIPELWSARLQRAFDAQYIWRELVTDLSSELTVGDTLHLNEVTSDVTVNDYTVNTDINDPETIDTGDKELVINKQKYFNIAIDDVERAQTRPNLMDEYSRKAGVEMAKQVDTDIYTVVNAGVDATRKYSGAQFPDANPDKTERETWIKRLFTLVEVIRDANVPEGVRPWCVLNKDVAKELVEYLIFDRDQGSGDLNDEAWVNARLSNFLGLNVRVDRNRSTTAATGLVQATVGLPQATGFARQIRRVEPYRLEKRFSDAIKGLMVYGTAVIDDRYLWQLTQS